MQSGISDDGPLAAERARASFTEGEMRRHLDPPEVIEFKDRMYRFFQSHPSFRPLPAGATLQQERRVNLERVVALQNEGFVELPDHVMQPRKARAFGLCIGELDWSTAARYGLLIRLIQATLLGMGTKRHMGFVQQLDNLEIGGAFCLTEIGHGSNTRALRCEARYDRHTRTFVLHTPDFLAAKCWAGNLGETCTHGIVFAQLINQDGVCHGLHCFFVPLRDPKTMLTYPGVTIADMGHKLGMNGIDNGVLLFDHYRVPHACLLNKTGDVTPSGEYLSPYKDPNKRFGASLGNLALGRVSIVGFAVVNMSKALTIAVRYGAVRRQFGPPGEDEVIVLDYPLQQWRLFPHLAACYLLDHFSKALWEHLATFQLAAHAGDNADRVADFGQELHALSCCGKPVSGWMARDCIQECREACGGHGYLAVSGFGSLRNDNDANCTYEGDNNVILAQTSTFLLERWQRVTAGEQLLALPMGTSGYLADTSLDAPQHWVNCLDDAADDHTVGIYCLRALQRAARALCALTRSDGEKMTEHGCDGFTVRNNTQVFRGHTLAQVHLHVCLLEWYEQHLRCCPPALLPVLQRLWALHAAVSALPHLHIALPNTCGAASSCLQRHVLRLCAALRPDAVTLVDAVAPPDFCLNSALGCKDGRVYERLKEAMFGAAGATGRPPYWREMTYPQQNFRAKL